MKDVRLFLFALCLSSMLPQSICGQNGWKLEPVRSNDSPKGLLEQFLDANPKAIEVKILTEGTMAYLCADDDNLFVRLSVGNPQLFMRMLMQGLSIRIDPTGGKKSKYSILFPSACDVQSGIPGQAKESTNQRPDIGPLLGAMNNVGTVYKIKGKPQPMELSRSLIELDTENETLDYYVLIPKGKMMEEKKLSPIWSIGLYLDSPIGVFEGPRGDGEMQRPTQQHGRIQGRPLQPSEDKEMEKLMKMRINAWETFSIDDVNSINLK